MSECYGDYFILNGELTPSVMFNNSDVYEGDSVYEVLRMISGVPLFFADHMERLQNSVSHHGRKMLSQPGPIARDLRRMRKKACVKEANLKIVFNYKESGNSYLLYFIAPLYPTPQQYREGVNTIFFHAERENPEVKVINHRLRSTIYNRLISTNAYEAFLVDEEGYITEGSRSNIFFVGEGKLYTAPDEKVLGGITRKHVIDICNINGIEIEFRCIALKDAGKYESAFMTGTSPMVLPVKSIDDIEYNVDIPVVNMLRELYSGRVKESLVAFRQPG